MLSAKSEDELGRIVNHFHEVCRWRILKVNAIKNKTLICVVLKTDEVREEEVLFTLYSLLTNKL